MDNDEVVCGPDSAICFKCGKGPIQCKCYNKKPLEPPTGQTVCEKRFRAWLKGCRLILTGDLDKEENELIAGLMWLAWKDGWEQSKEEE